jgi:hypothetical protein
LCILINKTDLPYTSIKLNKFLLLFIIKLLMFIFQSNETKLILYVEVLKLAVLDIVPEMPSECFVYIN